MQGDDGQPVQQYEKLSRGQYRSHRTHVRTRGIWYAQKIEPDNPTFQIGLYVEILGPLDVDVMRRAVGTTVAEADSLNVVFGEDEQGVFQKHGSPRSHLHFHDLRGGSVDESMAKAQALMEADLATVHDTETGELAPG